MTTITFKQRNVVDSYFVAGCSSLTLPDPNIAGVNVAQVDGSSGSTQYTRTITGSESGASSEIMLAGWTELGVSSFPHGGVYEAGDWICRLNVSQRNSAVIWSSVYICLQTVAGASPEYITIASKTDVNALLASTGTKVVTLTTGSPTDLSAVTSPRLYWLYGFQKSTSAEQTFKYRSNKNLKTPIVVKVNAPVVALAGSVASPPLPCAVPSVVLAGSVVSPGLLFGSSVKAPPRSRIASTGIEIGAGVVSTSVAMRGASSALDVGASSSSSLAAARYSWSGQVLGAAPCGALVAGRTFSTQQRLSTPVGSAPVSSRIVDSCLDRGGSRISGVVAAASPMSGVESGVVAHAD